MEFILTIRIWFKSQFYLFTPILLNEKKSKLPPKTPSFSRRVGLGQR